MQMSEERKYDGWLVSDSLIKRSLAVYGHSALGGLIIFGVFFMFLFVLGLIAGLFGAALM